MRRNAAFKIPRTHHAILHRAGKARRSLRPGNLTQVTDTRGQVNEYVYDAANRRTQEIHYLNAVANRLTDTKTTGALSYNANNQLTAAGNVSYSYDANGNTTNQTDSANAANTRNYVYDTSDRLIQVRDSNNTLIAVYSYDPFGRRLSKDTGTQKTFYLYNEEGLIAEADATGQVTKSYGYAPGSTYSTNPLFMKSGANYYYYQNDHLGTPQKLVTQSGQVVWSATYDAFGGATVGAGYTLTNNLRLPGQYFDQETGMHYNWHRYYDPKEGRYISSDPIGLYGGINLYTYVGENPLNGIDPTGLIQIYGNWCGSDWTGGRKESYSPPKSPDYYKSPRDELDGACKTHDICYYKCRNNNKCDKQKRSSCFRLCDHVLTKSAYEIGGFWGDVVGAAIDRPGNRDPEPNDASCSQCK